MTANPLSGLFVQPVENLNACTLIKSITAANAGLLAVMLAKTDPWQHLNISDSALENYLMRNDSTLFRYLIQVKNQPAGVVCIRYPWLRGPYIELLGLDENYRGLGVGREVLQWIESEAKRECKNLWVITSSFNHKAQQFYQRQGFVKTGVIPALIRPEDDEILFRKCWE